MVRSAPFGSAFLLTLVLPVGYCSDSIWPRLRPAHIMGKNTGGEAETVDQFLDSSLDSVDSAEQLVLDVARKAGFQEEDLHKIGMAVRESMVNAVVHGNQYSAHKKVRVSVSKGSDRLTITISDQGKGFELEALPDPLSEENL